MIDCKQCVKSDVCGKKQEVKELWESLMVNSDFQNLLNNCMKIDIGCVNFLDKEQPKILRGE